MYAPMPKCQFEWVSLGIIVYITFSCYFPYTSLLSYFQSLLSCLSAIFCAHLVSDKRSGGLVSLPLCHAPSQCRLFAILAIDMTTNSNFFVTFVFSFSTAITHNTWFLSVILRNLSILNYEILTKYRPRYYEYIFIYLYSF